LIYSFTLYASQSCYSVQLWSVKNSQGTEKEQLKNELKGCSLLHIGSYDSMRCGCYKTIQEITTLNEYKKKYKNAYIVQTLQHRFKRQKIVKNEFTVQPKPKYFLDKYNFNVLDVNLTSQISEEKFSANNDLPRLMDELSSNAKMQMQQIQSNSGLFGLSIQGKYDQYAKQNYLNREYTDYEYNVKLKYDIFKNGYFEHQTNIEEGLAKTAVLHYQNLINLQKYNYSTNLNSLKALLNKINARYYDALVDLYNDAIKRMKNLLESGMQTKYNVNKLIHEKDTFLSLKKVYQDKSSKAIDKAVYEMLLRVENIKLIPLQTIQTLSKKSNSEILMQNAQSDFLSVENNPYNAITLNVYSSLRAMDEVGSYVTVGAELNLPLNFSYSETKRLNALQIQANCIKREAVEKYLNSSLKNLYKEFYTLQGVISTDKDSINNLHLELNDFKTIAMYNLASLKVDFEQQIFKNQSNIIDLKYKILLKRVEMLKILMNISYLSNIYDIKKLTIEKQ